LPTGSVVDAQGKNAQAEHRLTWWHTKTPDPIVTLLPLAAIALTLLE
jgi:hypothetical protein